MRSRRRAPRAPGACRGPLRERGWRQEPEEGQGNRGPARRASGDDVCRDDHDAPLLAVAPLLRRQTPAFQSGLRSVTARIEAMPRDHACDFKSRAAGRGRGAAVADARQPSGAGRCSSRSSTLLLPKQRHAEPLRRDAVAQPVVEHGPIAGDVGREAEELDTRIVAQRVATSATCVATNTSAAGMRGEARDDAEAGFGGVVDVGAAERLVEDRQHRAMVVQRVGQRADPAHLGQVEALAGGQVVGDLHAGEDGGDRRELHRRGRHAAAGVGQQHRDAIARRNVDLPAMFGPVTTHTRGAIVETEIVGDAAVAGIEERMVEAVDGEARRRPRIGPAALGGRSRPGSTSRRRSPIASRMAARIGRPRVAGDAVERHARRPRRADAPAPAVRRQLGDASAAVERGARRPAAPASLAASRFAQRGGGRRARRGRAFARRRSRAGSP